MIFLAMIILGLVGVYLVSRFDQGGESNNSSSNQVPVAE
jgi:drug/metabolite transporter (DMT)-like permease